jgi:hypothetical protein
MKKSSFALVLLSSPAFAQTPNLAPAPPIDKVGNPALCLPIGKTSSRVTSVAQLCAREKCSVRQVNMTISLALLAPNLVKAAVEGRLPRGIGIERLRDPPTEWSRQFEALGLHPE